MLITELACFLEVANVAVHTVDALNDHDQFLLLEFLHLFESVLKVVMFKVSDLGPTQTGASTKRRVAEFVHQQQVILACNARNRAHASQLA